MARIFNSNKKYKNIRELVRLVSLYGLYSKKDLMKIMGIKSSVLEKRLKMVRNMLGEDIFIAENRHHQHFYFTDYNFFRHHENYLAKTYMAKSTTSDRFALYFLVISELGAADSPLTQTELFNSISLRSELETSPSSIRRLLDDMKENGVIQGEKIDGVWKYHSAASLWEYFDDDEMNQIQASVKFFKEIYPLSLPGHYLSRSLESVNGEINNTWLYRFRKFHSLLDEVIVWEMLDSLQEGKMVSVEYTDRTGQEMNVELIPCQFRYDDALGRWYLIGLGDEDDFVVLRLDRIEKHIIVKKGRKLDETERMNIADLILEAFKYSWGITSLRADEEPVLLEIECRPDHQMTYDYRRTKVEREKRWGRIIEGDLGSYELHIEVANVQEIKPWIRSFGSYMRVKRSSEHNLYEIMHDEWKEALKLYE